MLSKRLSISPAIAGKPAPTLRDPISPILQVSNFMVAAPLRV
jgi:hypothetical protein